jgi:hypothetical protein
METGNMRVFAFIASPFVGECARSARLWLAEAGATSGVSRKPDAGELPPFVAVEKIPIAGADMAARRSARATTEDHLIDHELTIVLGKWAGVGLVPGIRQISAGGPFPYVAEHL